MHEGSILGVRTRIPYNAPCCASWGAHPAAGIPVAVLFRSIEEWGQGVALNAATPKCGLGGGGATGLQPHIGNWLNKRRGDRGGTAPIPLLGPVGKDR